MTITAQNVSEIMSAFLGKTLLKHECEAIAKRLGSSDELFAWLFLRQEHGGDIDASVMTSLRKIATDSIGRAVTRRTQVGFPLRERHAVLELEKRLGKLLVDDADHRRRASEHAYEALVEFGEFTADPTKDIRISMGPKLC